MNSNNADETTGGVEQPQGSDEQAERPAAEQQLSTEDLQETYAEYARWIDRAEPLDRVLLGRYRRQQFGDVEGRVLDVACGTGTNFSYLPGSVDLVGIDISDDMLAYAESELERLDGDGTLFQMDAASLEFEDDRFDFVISALSTCTFPDRIAALREMERVCSPTGEIRLLEHGRSNVDLLARFQEWRADAHYAKTGCRATQEPVELVQQAGLSIETVETGQFGRITTIVATPR
jgi:ubiquinone/menaquinone biosynthesis C-methylase UbiE